MQRFMVGGWNVRPPAVLHGSFRSWGRFRARRFLVRELKDVALQKSLWGRICNYGHLLLISSDRLMGETTLKGLPEAER